MKIFLSRAILIIVIAFFILGLSECWGGGDTGDYVNPETKPTATLNWGCCSVEEAAIQGEEAWKNCCMKDRQP